MKNYLLLIIALCVCCCANVYSQDNTNEYVFEGDSINSAVAVLSQDEQISITDSKFIPDPNKAVLYSIIPGLGQIYNKKYWKLPIVYGGFIGCAYAITWNHKTYKDYKNAYRDILDDDPSTNSWQNYGSNEEILTPILKRRRDSFRRYRDLSCFIAVGLYAVCMVDAYVDAHLFEFDISQDLSLKLDPVMFDKTQHNDRAFGLQCSFSF
ncbi:hypothetical protein M2138_000034 [Dysgonomonadaceae bacterium PH5-43]|nr:hypothetical protein [Dysgonomonadaceae bacterium PH5-43]